MGSQEGFAVEVCAHQLERAFSRDEYQLGGHSSLAGYRPGGAGLGNGRRQAAALARRVSGDGALSLRQVREASPELERLPGLVPFRLPSERTP